MKTPNHITQALSTLNQYHAGIVRADLLTLREFRASQKDKRCKGWGADTVFIKAEPLKAWLHTMPIEKASEMLASEMLMGWWEDDNSEPNPHDEDGEYITNHGGLETFTDDEFEPWMIDDAVDSRLGGGCMFLDLSTFNMPIYKAPVPTHAVLVRILIDRYEDTGTGYRTSEEALAGARVELQSLINRRVIHLGKDGKVFNSLSAMATNFDVIDDGIEDNGEECDGEDIGRWTITSEIIARFTMQADTLEKAEENVLKQINDAIEDVVGNSVEEWASNFSADILRKTTR